MKKLYRSRRERIIAGVAGGLAEYFEVDVVIVRLFWVLATFAGGSGVIAYLLAALVIPQEPLATGEEHSPSRETAGLNGDGREPVETTDDRKTRPSSRRRSSVTTGWILIGLGLLFLLERFSVFPLYWIGRLWPLLLIALGIMLLGQGSWR